MVLSKGSRGNDVRNLQKALNMQFKLNLLVDGDYGNGTVAGVKAMQAKARLPQTGVYGEEEQKLLTAVIKEKFLSFDTVDQVAKAERLPAHVLKAIADVEAKGSGFLNDGRPVILFERHKFYKNLVAAKGLAVARAVQENNPNICHPLWDSSAYRGKEAEYRRLEQAKQFDESAALMSASWGMFQIMGENYKECGYSSVQQMVAAMYVSEGDHFKAVVQFIKKNKRILDAVLAENFVNLALYYNGPGYAANKYDVKLREAAKLYR